MRDFYNFIDEWRGDWVSEDGETEQQRRDELRRRAWDRPDPATTYDEAVERFGQEFVDLVNGIKESTGYLDEVASSMTPYFEQYSTTAPKLYRGIADGNGLEVGSVYESTDYDSWSAEHDPAADRALSSLVYYQDRDDVPATVLHLDEGDEGLWIDRVPNYLNQEKEWILEGDFEVTEELEPSSYLDRPIRNLRVRRRAADLMVNNTGGITAEEIEDIRSIARDTIDRLPYRMHQETRDLPIVVWYNQSATSSTAQYFRGRDTVEVYVGGNWREAGARDLMYIIGHEVWHAFTNRTNFWSSDEGLELLGDILLYDEWSGAADMQDKLDSLWGEGYWSKFGRTAQDEYDERMAVATGLIVAGMGDADFRRGAKEIVSGLMYSFINERTASSELLHDSPFSDSIVY